jgi:hypothetical protein
MHNCAQQCGPSSFALVRFVFRLLYSSLPFVNTQHAGLRTAERVALSVVTHNAVSHHV